MKVFISWSGSTSNKVAIVLKDWLESVIQCCSAYVSSEDIDKGARWATDIAEELEGSDFGIICLTKSNLQSDWIHFEAGALSKSIDRARVSPFLFNVKRSDVKGPLLQFQSAIQGREEILKLLLSVNAAAGDGDRLSEEKLKQVFDVWYPELEKSLGDIQEEESPNGEASESRVDGGSNSAAANDSILEEILSLVRSQQLLISSPTNIIPMEYLADAITIAQKKTGSSKNNVYVRTDHPVWRHLYSSHLRLSSTIHSQEGEEISDALLRELLLDIEQPVDWICRNHIEKGEFVSSRGPRFGRPR